MELVFTILIAFVVLGILIAIDAFLITKLDEEIIKTVWLTLGVVATLNYMFVRFEIVEHIAPVVVAFSIFKLYRK